MARRYHIHVDVNEEQALQLKRAAHRAHLLPSQYMLDRALRVADQEIQLAVDAAAAPPPEDIDRGEPTPEVRDEVTPEEVLRRLEHRRRTDRILARDFSPMP